MKRYYGFKLLSKHTRGQSGDPNWKVKAKIPQCPLQLDSQPFVIQRGGGLTDGAVDLGWLLPAWSISELVEKVSPRIRELYAEILLHIRPDRIDGQFVLPKRNSYRYNSDGFDASDLFMC